MSDTREGTALVVGVLVAEALKKFKDGIYDEKTFRIVKCSYEPVEVSRG